MKARPVVPVFSNTNCSQPRHPGFGEPAQAVLVKVFVFTWSVYAFATAGPVLPIGLLSLVTFVTVSKEPIAVDMNPVGAWPEMSSPLPTTRGRAPRRGGIG